MNEKRFFTKVNKNGRNVIIDKQCHIEIIDLTMVCDVLNRLDLKLKHYNEVNGEQQATIEQLQAKLREKEQEERLYANEILELRETNKEHIKFKSLGGDY